MTNFLHLSMSMLDQEAYKLPFLNSWGLWMRTNGTVDSVSADQSMREANFNWKIATLINVPAFSMIFHYIKVVVSTIGQAELLKYHKLLPKKGS